MPYYILNNFFYIPFISENMKIRIFKDYLTLLKIITHFGISPIFGGRHFRGGTLPHTLHAGKKIFYLLFTYT